ncbi:MAG: hypothetical protein FWG30_04225 [Eubacteriaceae bacterium]|nr:hypothetical protein [Eubacteriaceae bacterium]
MGKFIIGESDFGIGSCECELDLENLKIHKLEIIGDENAFESLKGQEAFEFRYYPISLPDFYLINAPVLKDGNSYKAQVNIGFKSRCDVGLEFSGDIELTGAIDITEGIFTYKGEAEIYEEKYALDIEAKL